MKIERERKKKERGERGLKRERIERKERGLKRKRRRVCFMDCFCDPNWTVLERTNVAHSAQSFPNHALSLLSLSLSFTF